MKSMCPNKPICTLPIAPFVGLVVTHGLRLFGSARGRKHAIGKGLFALEI